jgi:hypothetical protein
MYKTFKVADLVKYADNFRGGTCGYQPKYLTQDRSLFIKEQAVICNQVRDDWRVELFACKVANILGIPVVQQKPCILNYKNGKQRYGVYSTNFEMQGYQFISFSYLLQRNQDNLINYNYNNLNACDKMKCLSYLLSRYTNMTKDISDLYIYQLVILDILTGNLDRHLKNFGCFANGNALVRPLIFDNGLGLFEGVVDYNFCDSYDDFMRETYISPYGEDPFELLRLLKPVKLKNYLSALCKLENTTFPSKFAKQYYKNILDFIEKEL